VNAPCGCRESPGFCYSSLVLNKRRLSSTKAKFVFLLSYCLCACVSCLPAYILQSGPVVPFSRRSMTFIIPQISDQNISLLLSKAHAQFPTTNTLKVITESGVVNLVVITVSLSLAPAHLYIGRNHGSFVYFPYLELFSSHSQTQLLSKYLTRVIGCAASCDCYYLPPLLPSSLQVPWPPRLGRLSISVRV
jgi:hypothetical protein